MNNRELKDVEECFKGLITYINADEKTVDEVSDEVMNIINCRVKTPMPIRPPRGVFIYPPGNNTKTFIIVKGLAMIVWLLKLQKSSD